MAPLAHSRCAARSIRVDPALADEPGAAIRIGLVVIATDHTSERDFRRILPPAMDVLVSRVPCRTVTTVESLGEMAVELTQAAGLLLPGSDLHAIAFACTTGAIVIGEAEVARRIHRICPGVPVTTPIRAALDAFAAFGLRRISVVLPYVEAVNLRVIACLEAESLEIVSVVSFEQESDRDMARVRPDAIVAAGIAADHPDADGVFVSCTALRGAEAAEDLEQRLGKPVVTSNQALCWRLMRLTGVDAKIAGYGALLREH
jgi:maleate isomerase